MTVQCYSLVYIIHLGGSGICEQVSGQMGGSGSLRQDKQTARAKVLVLASDMN